MMGYLNPPSPVAEPGGKTTAIGSVPSWAYALLAGVYMLVWGWASTVTSFWADEEHTARMMELGWKAMFHDLNIDVHPPLYFILVRIWHCFTGWMGMELSLRSFSVLSGALGLLVYQRLFLRLYKDNWMVYYCILILSASPMLTFYATEARSYQFLILILGVSWIQMLKLLDNPRSITTRLTLGLGLAALPYTHTIGTMAMLSFPIFMFLRAWGGNLRESQLAAFRWSCYTGCLLYLPQIRTQIDQAVSHHHWWADRPSLNIFQVWRSLVLQFAGFSVQNRVDKYIAFIISFIPFLPLGRERLKSDAQKVFLSVFASLMFIPWLASQVITPFLIPRAVLPVTPFLVMALLSSLSSWGGWKAILLVTGLIATCWPDAWWNWHAGISRENMRAAAAFIAQHRQKGDVIVRKGIIESWYLGRTGLPVVPIENAGKQYWLVQRSYTVNNCSIEDECPGNHPKIYFITAWLSLDSPVSPFFGLDVKRVIRKKSRRPGSF